MCDKPIFTSTRMSLRHDLNTFRNFLQSACVLPSSIQFSNGARQAFSGDADDSVKLRRLEKIQIKAHVCGSVRVYIIRRVGRITQNSPYDSEHPELLRS